MSEQHNSPEWQRAGDEIPQPPKRHRSLASGDLADAMDLREFLTALGPVMRLPRKEGEGPEDPAPKGPARQSRLLVAALAVVILGAAWVLLSRWNPGEQAVPEAVLGTWTTSSTRYADRGFVITADSLYLRVGGGQTVAHPLDGARRGRGADSALVTLHYRAGGEILEMGLRLGPEHVTLANLPEVTWKREAR
jgi:hypothetical protein